MNAKVKLPLPKGVKRHIASVLAAVLEVLRAIPGTAEVVFWLEKVAGAVGIVGLGSAAAQGSLGKFKLAGLSALVSSVILLAYFIPGLEVLLPVLYKVAAVLGAAAAGAKVQNK